MRDEAVIAGVAHRRIEETVDHQRAGFLVHLILNRLAANRHFDDDVDFVWRVGPDRDRIDTHERLRVCRGWSRPAAIWHCHTRARPAYPSTFRETMNSASTCSKRQRYRRKESLPAKIAAD